VHLDAGAVELVFERRFAQLRERGGDVVRRLREHRLERAEQLQAKPRQPGGALRERGVRHHTQVAREHGRAPHALGIESRRTGHGLDHQSFQRPLTQLADQQAEQEFLLLRGALREQLTQQSVFRRGGAFARGPSHPPERGVQRAQLEGGTVRRPLGPRRPERGVPHADASLAQRPRQSGDRRLDFVRRRPFQQGGQQVDLGAPAARRGDLVGRGDELVKLHCTMPKRLFRAVILMKCRRRCSKISGRRRAAAIQPMRIRR